MIFDTHAHYDDEQFDEDRVQLLEQLHQDGVEFIMNVGSDLKSWDAIEKLVEEYPFIYGAAGIHPEMIEELNEENFARMRKLLQKEKFVAVGEIGLDYNWNDENKDLQKKWFIRQLDLARELDLPVIIHSRDAACDTLEIMKEHAVGLRGVIHCFSYSPEIAKTYVDMGFYLGIGGVVTFKNAKKLKEVVQEIPLSSLVLETDCPYLAPTPYRGTRNHSLNLRYVAAEIAELKGISTMEVLKQTNQNAKELYRIPSLVV